MGTKKTSGTFIDQYKKKLKGEEVKESKFVWPTNQRKTSNADSGEDGKTWLDSYLEKIQKESTGTMPSGTTYNKNEAYKRRQTNQAASAPVSQTYQKAGESLTDFGKRALNTQNNGLTDLSGNAYGQKTQKTDETPTAGKLAQKYRQETGKKATTYNEYESRIGSVKQSDPDHYYQMVEAGKNDKDAGIMNIALDAINAREKNQIAGTSDATKKGDINGNIYADELISSRESLQDAEMTNAQREHYYFLMGNNGRAAAEEYRQTALDGNAYMDENGDTQRYGVNKNIADRTYNDYVKPMGTVGKAAVAFQSGIKTGVGDIADSGRAWMGDTTYKASAPNDYMVSALINDEDNTETEKTVYELAQNIGNNLPAQAAGLATGSPLVGSLVFASQAGSSAYKEAINSGKTYGEAVAFGALQAADEEITNYLLGGITGIGGGQLVKALSNTAMAGTAKSVIKSVLNSPIGQKIAMGAIRAVADGGSEALQEYVQYFSEQLERYIAFGENPDYTKEDGTKMNLAEILTNKEALHSAFIGFANAMLMNAPNQAAGVAYDIQTGSALEKGAAAEAAQIDTNANSYRTEEAAESARNVVEMAKAVQRAEERRSDDENPLKKAALDTRDNLYRGFLSSALDQYMEDSEGNYIPSVEEARDEGTKQARDLALEQYWEDRKSPERAAAVRETEARNKQAAEMNEAPAQTAQETRTASLNETQANEQKEETKEARGTEEAVRAENKTPEVSKTAKAAALEIGKQISEQTKTESHAGTVYGTTQSLLNQRKANDTGRLETVTEAQDRILSESNAAFEKGLASAVESFSAGYGEKGKAAYKESAQKVSNPVQYSRAFNRVYNLARYGQSLDQTTSAETAMALTEDQLNAAYTAGVEDRKAANYKINHSGTYKERQEKRTGGAVAETGKANQSLVKALNTLGEKTGIIFKVVDRSTYETDEEGNEHRTHEAEGKGSYASGNGVIEIDISSKNPLATVSHEMTHWIREYAPAEYISFRDAVVNALVRNGYDIQERVKQYQETYKEKKGQDLSEEDAIEEIVADSTGQFLNDDAFINEISSENKTIAGRIVEWLNSVIDAIRDIIRYDGLSGAAQYLRKDLKLYEEARSKWMNAVDAAEWGYNQYDYTADGTVKLDETGFTDESGITRFTVQTYENGGRQKLREWLKEYSGLSEKDQSDIINTMEWGLSIAQEYKNDESLGSFGRWSEADLITGENEDGETVPLIQAIGENGIPVKSVIVNNGEYPLNIDFTQVCKKRLTLNTVLNELIRRDELNLPTLSEANINTINSLIKEHGFEIACGLCFVDAKRYRVGKWAGSFVNGMSSRKSGTEEVSKYGYNRLVNSMAAGTGAVVDKFNFTGRTVKQPKGTRLSTLPQEKLNLDLIRKAMGSYAEWEGNKVTSFGSYTDSDGKRHSPNEDAKIAYALYRYPELRHELSYQDLIASEGLDKIKETNQKLYTLINSHWGAGKPKLPHSYTAYGNDILEAGNNGWKVSMTPEAAYKVGGVRLQSFSDYVPNLFFDYMQMTADMAAKQLPSHAYTKEVNFVLQFGMTGIKINMSIVPKAVELSEEDQKKYDRLKNKMSYTKLREEFKEYVEHAGLAKDENGEWTRYIIEDETFPLKEALKIQKDPRYAANCGIIWVGVSDPHIWKMMDDDNVPMIIPYHKSGLSQTVAKARNIMFYNDYTEYQTTKKRSGDKWTSVSKDFDFYGALEETGDPMAAADAYLKWCDDNNYRPKFPQFVMRPDGTKNQNYYKLLIDFKVYDYNGSDDVQRNYLKQGAVKMNFPENMKELVGKALREQQATESDLEGQLTDEQGTLLNDIKKALKLGKNTEKYSVEVDDSALPSREELFEENRDIKKANAYLTNALRNIAGDKAPMPSSSDIRKVVKTMKDKYTSQANSKDIEDKITRLYTYIRTNREVDGAEVQRAVSSIANEIIDSATYKDADQEAKWKSLKKDLRETKIYIPKENVTDYDPDGITSLRKKWFGKINFTTNPEAKENYGQAAYRKLQEQHPDVFTLDADQIYDNEAIQDIMRAYELWEPKAEAVYKGETREEAVYELSQDILEEYFSKVGDEDPRIQYAKTYKQATEDIRNGIKADFEKRLKKIAESNARQINSIEVQRARGLIDEEMYLVTRKALEDHSKMVNDAANERWSERFDEVKQKEADRKAQRVDSELRDKLLREAKALSRMKGGPEFEKKKLELIGNMDLIAKGISERNRIRLTGIRDQLERSLEADPTFQLPGKKLMEQIERLEKLHISEMSSADVQELLNTILQVRHEQATQNRELAIGNAQEISWLGDKLITDTKDLKGIKLGGIRDKVNNYTTLHLNAKRAFRMFSGYNDNSVLMHIYRQLDDGQIKQLRFKQETAKHFEPAIQDRDFVKGLYDPTVKVMDERGRTATITPAMRISLYLHSKNDHNMEHILRGGITVPNQDLYKKGRYSDAYGQGSITLHFTKAGIDNICSKMTDSERKFADAAYKWFNENTKKAINETSLMMDGIEKATVDDYFPIKSDPLFMGGDLSGLIMDATIEGWGSLKSRENGASNTILLEDVTQVINRQMENTALYYGLAAPIRNFNRVFEFGYNRKNGQPESVKRALAEAWGNKANSYIEKIVRDLQGGNNKTKDASGKMLDDAITKARSNFAGATLSVNPSVTIKQAASYPTAAAKLGYSPLIRALNPFSSEMKNYSETGKGIENLMKEVDRWTPLLWNRTQGMSDMALAEVSKRKNQWQQSTAWNKTKDFFNWIQKTDVMTVRTLWVASKYYVSDNFKDLTYGSDKYFQKVAEVFNETVEDTQPNYTELQRPSVQRNENELVKSLFMFKTQPLQNFGIVYDAANNYTAKKQAWDAVKNDPKNKNNQYRLKKYNEAKTQLARAVSSLTVSAAVFSAMTTVAAALLSRMNPFRDKETGEITAGSMASKYVRNMFSSMAGMMIGAGELYNFLESKISGSSYDAFSAGDIDMINDAITNVSNAFTKIQDDVTDEKANAKAKAWMVAKDVNKAAAALSKLAGVPVENVEKLLTGIANHVKDAAAAVQEGTAEPVLQMESSATVTNKQYAKRIENAFDKYGYGSDRYNRELRKFEEANEGKDLTKALSTQAGESLFDRAYELYKEDTEEKTDYEAYTLMLNDLGKGDKTIESQLKKRVSAEYIDPVYELIGKGKTGTKEYQDAVDLAIAMSKRKDSMIDANDVVTDAEEIYAETGSWNTEKGQAALDFARKLGVTDVRKKQAAKDKTAQKNAQEAEKEAKEKDELRKKVTGK